MASWNIFSKDYFIVSFLYALIIMRQYIESMDIPQKSSNEAMCTFDHEKIKVLH